MAVIVGHSQTKGRANSEPNLGLTHRATAIEQRTQWMRATQTRKEKRQISSRARRGLQD